MAGEHVPPVAGDQEEMPETEPEAIPGSIRTRRPERGWTRRLKCCRKSIPMIGLETPAKRKFQVYVTPENLTETAWSPQHGMLAPEGPEMSGPEVAAAER